MKCVTMSLLLGKTLKVLYLLLLKDYSFNNHHVGIPTIGLMKQDLCYVYRNEYNRHTIQEQGLHNLPYTYTYTYVDVQATYMFIYEIYKHMNMWLRRETTIR